MKATKGNRLHIGFFGKRNVGKSSIVNRITGRETSIVSDIAGTTTDINEKSMELLPIGPVVLMDTAGVDDTGELGKLRVEKTNTAIMRTDVAVMVFDNRGVSPDDINFLNKLREMKIPVLSLINKEDLGKISGDDINKIKKLSDEILTVSALNGEGDFVSKIKSALIKILPEDFIKSIPMVSDIVKPLETAVLVIPVDKEAPKGRIILPQVNVLRDLLDIGAKTVVCGVLELKSALKELKNPPKVVITDSQAFREVSEIVPPEIMLTSFSIIFARIKGDLKTFIEGSKAIDKLSSDDKVLILESCAHHPVEDDIGRVKIPALIKKYTGKNIVFEHYSGHDFPSDISRYSLIIHCGACMTNRREILNRINLSIKHSVPITNYGIAIAKCLNILDRALEPFNLS